MVAHVNVGHHVEFVAHVVAGLSGFILPNRVAARAVEGVLVGVEPEHVVLRGQGQPLGRIDDALGEVVVDVLAADDVGEPEVVVAEREGLVEGAAGAGVLRVGVAAGVLVAEPELRVPRAIAELITHVGVERLGHDRLVRVAADLEHAFEIEQPVLGDAGIARAERAHVVRARHAAIADGHVLIGVLQVQVVKIDGLTGLRAVGEPRPAEELVVVRRVELAGPGRNHGLHAEHVEVPLLGAGEHLEAFEGSPRVHPIQWADESLGTVEEFLTTGAEVDRVILLAESEQAEVGEQVEDVAAVDVGGERGQAAGGGVRVEEQIVVF